ncbi:TetR/AcrR family transcriptional regulator [Planosporangium flavigriseum]|uniref:TetR family transcriptional regulator n=1 Tax=Planosporangium flavigriseum TaxID=373681 RepID=A0A8J3M2M8_9ACTN|nr:TetR/AcrR family transcriptional regulator [Planosporangium flavigriseum]NJC65924.1 TetR/AcrR family transcriptional regulator [Planosporangium flavigriseum]GIG75630.1 TetR family transcriptional regulator [Planosporangium flavigriseum]
MTQPDPSRADQAEAERRRVDQRRVGRSRNRRDEILRVAFDLFAERGYRGTSLAAVADRAGLTQQGLLHYFPNKEALLVEVLQLSDELDIRRPLAKSTNAVPSYARPLDQLAELVAYNSTRPSVIRSLTVLATESLTDDHPARSFFVERYADLRRGAEAALRTELPGRLPGGVTAEQASVLLIAVIEGLQLQWLLRPDEIDMARLFTAFLQLIREMGETE